MSAIAQAIVKQIRSLPADEQREVVSELTQISHSTNEPVADADPIRSARGMFAGSDLLQAFLAERDGDRVAEGACG